MWKSALTSNISSVMYIYTAHVPDQDRRIEQIVQTATRK